MPTGVKLVVTEGVDRFGDGTVRCFFDTDYSYGYWVSQKMVEEVLGHPLNYENNRDNNYYVHPADANKLIEAGQTIYTTKRFFPVD